MGKTLDGRLSGKVAVVTGGSQGVGLGIARRLARDGATMVLAQRNIENGERTAEDLRRDFGAKVAFVQTDVKDAEQINRLIATASETFGSVDILVNNAGGGFPKKVEDHTDADMAEGLDLNFWSTFRAMRAAFPAMRKNGWGRVINLGSLNGVNAHMFQGQYNVAKEAIRALTRTAAAEWMQYGITCNILCPMVVSPAAEAYQREFPDMFANMVRQIPRRKLGDAEIDVGGVASFIASDDAAHITGMTFFVDGGAHISGISWSPGDD